MKYAYLIIFNLILLSSCLKSDPDMGDNPSAESREDYIGWNVSADTQSDASQPSLRALIGDYDALRDACTQFETQEAEKIGLLGKYTLDGTSQVAFDNVDLWWWTKEDGNPFNDILGNESYWNYEGESVKWVKNADYTFKAYFPKSKVNLQPGSDADKLLIVYDTEVSQYDLMVEHRQLRAYKENPVNLIMKHALAALKFDFQLMDEDVVDYLHSCWLENHREDGFYTSSTLNFDKDIVWPKASAAHVGTPIYYWEPDVAPPITGNKAVEAYYDWLLIIPQSSDEDGVLQLCFRTATGGNAVYRVDIPAYDFKAGYRYTYHVKMTSAEVKLGLTIADWNERKSSYEIDFNE